MKLKKLAALTLAVTMATGTLAGCGSSDTNADAQKSTSEAKTTQESQAAQEELDYVKLKMISVGDPESKPSEVFLEKVNEMLLEDLNCELEIQYLTFAEWSTKYPLIISSGEEFDIIFTASWTNYPDNARKGAYMELTEDMLKQYSPMYYEMAQTRLNNVKVDEKMYMYVQTQPDYSGAQYLSVRGDIMKEAGLEDITTPGELETYLDYVVENHPEMNVVNITGQDPAYAIVLAEWLLGDELQYSDNFSVDYDTCWNDAASATAGVPAIMDTSDPSNLKWVDQDIVNEEMLKIYNKTKELRERGYWDEDALSKGDNIEAFYVAGSGAAALRQIGLVDGWVYQLNNEHPEYDARMVKVTDHDLYAIGGLNGAAIGANSKNWERAMMVCDKFIGDIDYVNLLQYGLEDVHYTVNADGTYHIVENPEYIWTEPTQRSFFSGLMAQTDAHTDEYFEFLEEYADSARTPMLTLFAFDKTPVETEVAAIEQVCSQYSPILAVGLADDVEGFYKEYLAELEKVGYQKYLDELLKQAQAYYDSLN